MFYLRQLFKGSDDPGQILQRQTIDNDGPGTILPDFYQLLDFVGERNIAVTGTHLLPLKLLRPLNERLSRPLQLGLKRPQQKSFPHINGLYLLLRATGLGQIDHTAGKPRLVIDPAVFQSWIGLNPTEQYLTLLETWLIRGRGELVGDDRGSFWSDMPLTSVARFFEKTPAEGRQFAGDSGWEEEVRYRPGLYNLALLELFGLVRIQHGAVVEGKGWQIERVWREPLGDALLVVLTGFIKEKYEDFFLYDDPSEIPFGVLRPALQPYFPQQRNTLTFPAVEFQDGVYVVKVSLGWRNQIWRRIAVPATMSLDDLATAVINAYDFDFDHLYRFTYANYFGAAKHVSHPYMEEYPSTAEMRVGDLPLQPGASCEFLYDFGDSWKFTITLEEIEPPDPTMTTPKVLEEHGQALEQYGW